MRTRFQKEISGELGDFWKKHAEAEIEKTRVDLEAGKITIDADGIARNCIGRAVMDDVIEKLEMVTDKVDRAATQAARDAEIHAELEAYRANYKGPSAEELFEMRAAFGAGAQVVNFLTGDTIQL